MNQTDQTPILRLREFSLWAKEHGFCKTEYGFERLCGLAPKYISNNIHGGRGNIGTEILGRIVRVFPQLNLAWICTGEGEMLVINTSEDYRKAYEAAMTQIEALNRIIKQLYK